MVLAMLGLFALVGVLFFYSAEKQATASLHFRQSGIVGDSGFIDSDVLADSFLGQMIYDVPDDVRGIYSGLRGHSLRRLLYGHNDQALNTVPFNGTGRLHGPSPLPGIDDYRLVNYTFFSPDGFLRDPERPGWRKGPADRRGPFTGGFNAPYTYPDLNNLFLAAVNADGKVLLPSYHRPWLFNPGRPLNDRANPNWTNQVGKYLTLRPRPADMGPGFPYPAEATGDVRNYPGDGPADSVWIDIDFPVLRTREGIAYKPLFAPLVIDLDGRVNLNVHGNARARDAAGRPAHASNQGLGRWEVSLRHVLSGQVGGVDDWPNLLLGSPGRPGRYGSDRRPGAANAETVAGRPYHSYGQVDFDACQSSGGLLTPTARPFALPGAGLPRIAFPTFPTGYDNASGGAPAGERWEHPQLFNAYFSSADDRHFTPEDLAGVLLGKRYAPASALTALNPASFASPRVRGLVTTHSVDFDTPGLSPWIHDPRRSPYGFSRAPTDTAPSGPPLPFPSLSLRQSPVPEDSEFTAPLLPPDAPGVDWRCRTAGLGRVDLNRPLSSYPLPSPQRADVSGVRFDEPTRSAQFLLAQQERQRLADDVYNRLLLATGVPRTAEVPNVPSAEEQRVRRWLAQLAVNIVDFIDEDDISTPFHFYTPSDAQFLTFDPGELSQSGDPAAPDPELPKYWVFGTELPRLVLNEALAEYQEPPPPANVVGPPPPMPTTVRVWVELHNPLPTPPAGQVLQPRDGFPVRLQADAEPQSVVNKRGAYAAYKVVLASGMASRQNDDNVLGGPAAIRAATDDADFAAPVRLMTGRPQADPSPSVGPQEFFLLGPPGPDARNTLAPPPGGTVPAGTPRLQTANLEYRQTFAAGRTEEKAAGLTVLLRRLANPHIPPNPRPSIIDGNGEAQPNPWYNPYLTVDVLEPVPLNDANGRGGYSSRGKHQPYVSHPDQLADQVPAGAPPATRHTFGLPNDPSPDSGRYDWLVHLDRELISPPEILNVSACQPHQLTRRFVEGGGAGKKFGHLAPWFEQDRRLYRAFEFFTTHDRGTGAPAEPGGRVFGKINLNTVWDAETFLALCDAQPANGPNFTRDTVLKTFDRMLALRSPDLGKGGSLGPNDRPFQGLAAGYALPNGPGNSDPQRPDRGGGINDTLLRAAAADADGMAGGGSALPRLFQVPGEEHPYRQHELLTKIIGSVTTRSNVFAVWVTVGFFEVTDDSTMPPKLGAEFGGPTGILVRRRFFAIVDRSRLTPDARPGAFRAERESAILYRQFLD